MVSKFQWKPFWLATQRDPSNDWTAPQNRVNYNVFAQAPLPFKRRKTFNQVHQALWTTSSLDVRRLQLRILVSKSGLSLFDCAPTEGQRVPAKEVRVLVRTGPPLQLASRLSSCVLCLWKAFLAESQETVRLRVLSVGFELPPRGTASSQTPLQIDLFSHALASRVARLTKKRSSQVSW